MVGTTADAPKEPDSLCNKRTDRTVYSRLVMTGEGKPADQTIGTEERTILSFGCGIQSRTVPGLTFVPMNMPSPISAISDSLISIGIIVLGDLPDVGPPVGVAGTGDSAILCWICVVLVGFA